MNETTKCDDDDDGVVVKTQRLPSCGFVERTSAPRARKNDKSDERRARLSMIEWKTDRERRKKIHQAVSPAASSTTIHDKGPPGCRNFLRNFFSLSRPESRRGSILYFPSSFFRLVSLSFSLSLFCLRPTDYAACRACKRGKPDSRLTRATPALGESRKTYFFTRPGCRVCSPPLIIFRIYFSNDNDEDTARGPSELKHSEKTRRRVCAKCFWSWLLPSGDGSLLRLTRKILLQLLRTIRHRAPLFSRVRYLTNKLIFINSPEANGYI